MNDLADHLCSRLAQVRQDLGLEPLPPGAADWQIADVLDSMALVEYLAILAEDCGVESPAIERAVRGHFGTLGELARAMQAAGICPRMAARVPEGSVSLAAAPRQPPPAADCGCWLAATAVRLPEAAQSADAINQQLQRPAGWLERHAGIRSRRVWGDQDPLTGAEAAGRECLAEADLTSGDVGALLVTLGAPPQVTGLAAALHHRLALRPDAPALEVGGACTGFLAALWLARLMLPRTGPVLVLAVEAPSRWLPLQPSSAGEAAALFGDAAAAALVGARPLGKDAVPLEDVVVGSDGSAGGLLQVEGLATGGFGLRMEGRALAGKAVHVMARVVRRLLERRGLTLAQVEGVVAHGGNGRLPALLARRLGLPAEAVWSATAWTGNLGSASLPVAWATHSPAVSGPVVWTTVGAGLSWGVALIGAAWDCWQTGYNVLGK